MDIGDGDDENLSLRLHFVGGTTSDIVVTHSRPWADEAIIFVGLVANERFDRIEFINDASGSASPNPGLGFDDFVVGMRALPAIPEPSIYTLMLGGLALIAYVCRVRRASV